MMEQNQWEHFSTDLSQMLVDNKPSYAFCQFIIIHLRDSSFTE